MTEPAPPATPVPFLAAAAALEVINQSVKDAQQSLGKTPKPTTSLAAGSSPHPALTALLMLREVREELASWESGLIETARGEGASWADLAGPLGVASRQAAERRYLRLRPGSTGEERVQATRDERTVNAWARDNAADLRRLAAEGAPPAAEPGVLFAYPLVTPPLGDRRHRQVEGREIVLSDAGRVVRDSAVGGEEADVAERGSARPPASWACMPFPLRASGATGALPLA
ncbi:HSP18 transcriptional regulator [Streptomyces sp. NPDC002587]